MVLGGFRECHPNRVLEVHHIRDLWDVELRRVRGCVGHSGGAQRALRGCWVRGERACTSQRTAGWRPIWYNIYNTDLLYSHWYLPILLSTDTDIPFLQYRGTSRPFSAPSPFAPFSPRIKRDIRSCWGSGAPPVIGAHTWCTQWSLGPFASDLFHCFSHPADMFFMISPFVYVGLLVDKRRALRAWIHSFALPLFPPEVLHSPLSSPDPYLSCFALSCTSSLHHHSCYGIWGNVTNRCLNMPNGTLCDTGMGNECVIRKSLRYQVNHSSAALNLY